MLCPVYRSQMERSLMRCRFLEGVSALPEVGQRHSKEAKANGGSSGQTAQEVRQYPTLPDLRKFCLCLPFVQCLSAFIRVLSLFCCIRTRNSPRRALFPCCAFDNSRLLLSKIESGLCFVTSSLSSRGLTLSGLNIAFNFKSRPLASLRFGSRSMWFSGLIFIARCWHQRK